MVDDKTKIERFVNAYNRLKNVIDNNVGFPECVEASNNFALIAYEAAEALTALQTASKPVPTLAEVIEWVLSCYCNVCYVAENQNKNRYLLLVPDGADETGSKIVGIANTERELWYNVYNRLNSNKPKGG